jgi:etoposide-induced 2.4 mRNA
MNFKACLLLFLNGFRDSIYGCFKFFQREKQLKMKNRLPAADVPSQPGQGNLDSKTINSKATINKKDEKLRQLLIQSCVLNGVFLLSCILAFNYILIPALNWLAYKLIDYKNQNLVDNYLNPTIQVLFSFVWILPVFLLSKFFNLICHQKIADIAYMKKEEEKKKNQIIQPFSFSKIIANTVFSCIMELIFLMQCSVLLNLIPINWLNQIVCHFHLAFLYSLYAFEYKWCNMNWTIVERIDFIESRWPYFFGFGLSLSIILSFIESYIYSAILFASIFPVYILSSIEADCEESLKDDNVIIKLIQLKLPLFKFSLYLTNCLFMFFFPTSKLANETQSINKTNKVNDQPIITFRKTN